MVAAASLGYEIQAFQRATAPATVQVLTGKWAVQGVTGLPVSAGCGFCSTTVAPSKTITIHLIMWVEGVRDSGCTLCGGYNVSGIVVEPPFTLLAVDPSPSPTLVSQNRSMEWNLTVEAPELAGAYWLNGVIEGASF
ncbi:MAG: hypothetical protein ACHQ2Y_06605 [Candidatus Lutacidiplasmatales archaeon]